jgi:S-adenosylmethionine:tRNA ribosyltransferase-isomerase
LCLLKSSKPPKREIAIELSDGYRVFISPSKNGGLYEIRFEEGIDSMELIKRIGKTPLPPYIKRELSSLEDSEHRSRYQTVYASRDGSVAAPTAGLHFTKGILNKIEKRGCSICRVTLHIGPLTFLGEKYGGMNLPSEEYMISDDSALKLNDAVSQSRRIVAVGTSTVRLLETIFDEEKRIKSKSGNTSLLIEPGYRFKIVDRMLTNFHMPGSSPMKMVEAFIDQEIIEYAYQQAISKKYRFYSYGDCMFIIRN